MKTHYMPQLKHIIRHGSNQPAFKGVAYYSCWFLHIALTKLCLLWAPSLIRKKEELQNLDDAPFNFFVIIVVAVSFGEKVASSIYYTQYTQIFISLL